MFANKNEKTPPAGGVKFLVQILFQVDCRYKADILFQNSNKVVLVVGMEVARALVVCRNEHTCSQIHFYIFV